MPPTQAYASIAKLTSGGDDYVDIVWLLTEDAKIHIAVVETMNPPFILLWSSCHGFMVSTELKGNNEKTVICTMQMTVLCPSNGS